jgi:hypothetical protein
LIWELFSGGYPRFRPRHTGPCGWKSTAPYCFKDSGSAFLLLLWPKWRCPRRWCGSCGWMLVGFLEEEEDGPDRVLKSTQGLQCLILGHVCNFLVILALSVIVSPTAMNRSSSFRVLCTRSGSKKKVDSCMPCQAHVHKHTPSA